MERFSRLYEALETTTSTNAKIAALIYYFAESEPQDAAWAVFFLSGNRLKRLLGGARLREWLLEESALPPWLVEECYAAVGDLAETISLLIPGSTAAADNLSLEHWLTQLYSAATRARCRAAEATGDPVVAPARSASVFSAQQDADRIITRRCVENPGGTGAGRIIRDRTDRHRASSDRTLATDG
jgi:hypothetical protein